jgi:hypothetical protein
MSQLLEYINSLPDSSFDSGVKAHFEALGLEVKEEGPRYMLVLKAQAQAHAIKQAVGTILTKDTNLVCCMGFPLTVDAACEIPPMEAGPFVVSNYVNGTLVRAYYASDCWKLSTNCVINAYESFWGSEMSFGDMVDDCLQEQFSKSSLATVLNPAYSYQFMLQHPKDCHNHPAPLLHHIGTFNNTTLQYVHRDEVLNHPKVVSWKPSQTMETFAKVQQHVLALAATGVIFHPQGQETTARYKLLHPAFEARRALLGNTPDFHLRYLECLATGTGPYFLCEFPHMLPLAITVQKALMAVTRDVHALYLEKFIKKNLTVPVLYAYRPILYALHGLYKQTRQKITYQVVQGLIQSYHPPKQLFIFKSVGLV